MDIEKTIKAMFWRVDYYGAVRQGGIASMHNGMINGFKELNCECCYVSSGRVDLPENVNNYYIPYNKYLRNLPEVLCLPYNNKSVKEIKKIIEIEKPDFIFQHHHDFNFSGSLLKRDTGIPFFLHCDGVEYWVKRNWGKLYFDKLLRLSELIQWENADAIFVPSTAVKNMMIEYGGKEDKIIINPNGVNPKKFNPDIDGSTIKKTYEFENNYVCGFLGTFAVWHGIEILAKAVKNVIKMNTNIRFLFVGDGDLRNKVEDILNRDNVRQYCEITGLINHELIPEYLAACDCLITPTLQNQDNSVFFGSPTKLFEYLAMGKPIIASNVGQVGEVIIHNQNGILVNENNYEELAEAIIDLQKNPGLSKEISINARIDAVEKYDWKVNASRILNEFLKLNHREF